VARILSRIERALEDAVEGTSRRLFRSRLEPVMLAKAAASAMQEEQVIGPDGPETPNVFRILLHSTEFQRFASYRSSLEEKIERYLDRAARERGLRPVAPWRVEIEADETVRPRSIEVRASFQDVQVVDAPIRDGRPADAALTAPMPEARDGHEIATAQLRCEDGRTFTLADDVTSIGRALENDLVVPDTRVSRFHAEIHRDGGRFLVRDLKSTNGTMVAGRRIKERPLASGDEVSLGGYVIVFSRGPE
jgi:Protein of unknown function (DUF3662)/FHA domain